MTGLVERSLVRVIHEGGTRYSLLETIRSFASGRLVELDSDGNSRRRHLDWALRTGCAAEAELGAVGSLPQEWHRLIVVARSPARFA